jgi:hypothetical protein
MLKSEYFSKLTERAGQAMSTVSSEMLGWLAILMLHASTVPSLMAVMSGLSNQLPPIDLILMIWSALILLFVKASIQKDILNMITIGVGFFGQAVMMALIFFR